MDVPKLLEEAGRFAPELVATILNLIKSLAAKDLFGSAVYSAALIRQLAGHYDDGGRSFLRHVIRELAEHEVSDALADALMGMESVNRTLPKVT